MLAESYHSVLIDRIKADDFTYRAGRLTIRLAREFDWGQLAAAVNNLSDADYYTYAVRSQFTADRYAVYPLPGRSFSVSVELRMD